MNDNTDFEKIDIYCTVDDLYLPMDEPQHFRTTTSTIPYNMITQRFDNDVEHLMTVKARYIDSDYSEYVEDKSLNGGCYGFDDYEIVSVEWFDDMKLLSMHSMLSNKLYRTEDSYSIEEIREEIEDLEIIIRLMRKWSQKY